MEDLSLLESSALFDATWYAGTYADVRLSDLDPAVHYLRIGAPLGRNPSARFDAKAYEQTYPEALGFHGGALLHYLKAGTREHRIVPVVDVAGPARAEWRGRTAWHIDDHLRTRIAAAMELPIAPAHEAAAATIAPAFDAEFYVLAHPEILYSRLNPMQHYLQVGAKRGWDPSPHFGTALYRRRHKAAIPGGMNPFVHWVTEGRRARFVGEPANKFPPIARRLNKAPFDVSRAMTDRRRDLFERLRYGTLGEMVAKAAALDPLVGATWPAAFRPKMPPFHHARTGEKLVATLALRDAAGHRRAPFVIAVNRPRWGSGAKEEGYLAQALAAAYGPGSVLVVYTDAKGTAPSGRFDPAIRQIDLTAATEGYAEGVRSDLFLSFLRSLRPVAVFNINSQLAWTCQMTYRRLMAQEMRIYNYLFCNEKNLTGEWSGYPVKYAYRCFDHCAALIVDSAFLKAELVERFALPEAGRDRVRVISAPAETSVGLVPEPPRDADRRPQVFWSGRFDRQKRPDLLARIAERLPDVDFHVWGKALLDSFDTAALSAPNIKLKGTYETFRTLPLGGCDAWLYTSEWDGVPHLLLEVAMTGIPLVGSVVGGTAEVLRDDMSWPVEDVDDVEAYVRALREILARPAEARDRAARLRAHMAETRDGAGLRAFVAEFAEAVDGHAGPRAATERAAGHG